jgi:hypothetical protein
MRITLSAEKVGGEPAGWSSGPGRPDSLTLVLPLDADAPTTGTARLQLRATLGSADRDVSATLILTVAGRDLVTWRADWRPVHPHTNQVGSSALKGLEVWTGIHDFDENIRLGLQRMQSENLPICKRLEPEPHNFDAFVRKVCDILKIGLTEEILSPPWSPALF